MKRFQIESKSGQVMGVYEGERQVDALAAMHRDAGYDCLVVGSTISYRTADDAALCGSVKDWIIFEVAACSRQIEHELCQYCSHVPKCSHHSS